MITMSHAPRTLKEIIAAWSDADSMGLSDERQQSLLDALLSQETPEQGGWQTMETAPKDGTLLLVYRPGTARLSHLAIRTATEWCGPKCCPNAEPTHWMPLPALPTQDKETK